MQVPGAVTGETISPHRVLDNLGEGGMGGVSGDAATRSWR